MAGAVAVAAFEALVQTGAVMAQRYERGALRRIGRRSRSRVPLRL
ncbi:small membrane protein [Streptomyces sp. NRRL F-4707]|nr:small membrane protein [Streptomyces sp. NRRL F-4707]KOX50792.1 small membrane protein [Streptomyces sp. NRRL F-7442]